MNPKEINRESGPLFEGLLPSNWARRPQQDQEDYGVDYEIEPMTPGDKATGFIFKIQLKGTSTAKYDELGQLVFSEASVERFKYYINELRIPLVFVVCDIAAKECFWTKVQGNRQLESALREAVVKNQKTFTIKFPATRKILKNSEASAQIIEAVDAALDTITLRGLQEISPASVREHIGHEPDIESTEKQFRLFAGLAAAEAIKQLNASGDFENASKKARGILDSETEPSGVRIMAGISLVHVMSAELKHAGKPDWLVEAAKIKLDISSQMLRISRVKTCEVRLKRFIHIYTRATRMQINGRTACAIAFSEQAQAEGKAVPDTLTKLQRLQISAQVSQDFFKLLEALHKMGKKSLFSVMPYALAEIAEGIFPFVSSLRTLGRHDLAEGYVDALFDFLPFCIDVIRRFGSGSDIVEILNSLGLRIVGLANVTDEKSTLALLKRFENALEGTPALACRSEVLDGLKVFFEQVKNKTEAPPTMEQMRRHYAQQAAALGINLNDSNNRNAHVIRVGLADLDPTRILKKCRHMHVMITAKGKIAELLDLPTAGFKRLVCLKYGQNAEALSLDETYETFAEIAPWAKDQICCANCSEQAPHPDGWQWSQEWQMRQAEIYSHMCKNG